MANKRDYYEVLGVDKKATEEEIKRAYRKKAKECHPDLHPGDKQAEARFKELNEANEVLSDPDKRARYDQFGFDDPMQGGNPFGGAGGAGGFDFSGMGDIFDTFFGGMGGMGSRRSANAPTRGNDLRYEMRLTFEEAADGCEKSFDFFRNEVCDACNGTGAKAGTQPSTCPTCNGQGQIRSSGGWMTTGRTCPNCGGSGKVIRDKCPNCTGTGRLRKKRTSTIKIPAGIDNGQTLIQSGQGEPGRNGGPNGDLYITVSVRPHKLFRRDGYNLLLDFPISFTQAALGAEVDIPTLHSSVKFKIPEGTQNDTEFRIRGQGIQQLRSAAKGDLVVRVRVEIPRKLTEKQKDLLRQFDGTISGHEYEGKKNFFDKLKNAFN